MMNSPEVRLTQGSDVNVSSHWDAFRSLAAAGWKRWLVGVSIAFVALFALCLLFVPQTYSSTLSMAIVQSSDMGQGLLSSAAGLGQSPTTKYVGVLQSRLFAERVEDQVHLQALYHLPERADAVEMIMDNLVVKDAAKEGLLYVSLALPGPATLWPGGNRLRVQVRETAARAVNLYAALLRDYMAHSDVDRDSILLEGAQDQIRQVRKDYDAEVARLADLVRRKGAHMEDLLAGGQISGDATPNSGTAVVRDLASFYAVRATLESDIEAAKVALNGMNARQNDQLHHTDSLPTEDPMLMHARAGVEAARADYEAARLQYGPDNPRVTLAHDRLQIAERVLSSQRESVRTGRTSPQIEAQVRLEALQTRHATLLRQIEEAERKAKTGRTFLTEFDRQRGEVMLRLEILKAASAHAATLSIQTIAASRKLTVVDSGIPARKATPGIGLMAVLSLTLSLFGLVLTQLPAYGRIMREFPDAVVTAREGVGGEKQAA